MMNTAACDNCTEHVTSGFTCEKCIAAINRAKAIKRERAANWPEAPEAAQCGLTCDCAPGTGCRA